MNSPASEVERPADNSWGARWLLVGILVVAGLCWLVSSPVVNVSDKLARTRAEAFLAEIQGGLDNYKIDHGVYPPNPAVDRNEAAVYGAHILYKHLSGDFGGDGEFDSDDPSNKIYVESLDFRSSQRQGKGTVGIDREGRYIATDGYGNPIRYLCDLRDPNTQQREIRTLNPAYDLWSIGEAEPGKDDPENQAKWITNWGTN